MRRAGVLLLVLLLALMALVAVATAQSDEPTHRVTDARGEFFDVVLPITVDTIPVTTTTAPTTTTVPPTTTTVPPTTTTVPPTTTTVPPTTTTTTAPSAGLPDYIDLGTLQRGEGYAFDVQEPSAEEWWSANYFFDLPYQPGYGWGAGDKCGYLAVYGLLLEDASDPFLVYPPDTRFWDIDGTPIGRFRVTRPVGGDADYVTRMNDTYMVEGQRHYDGTLERLPQGTGEGFNQAGFDECPTPDANYPAYAGTDERPTVYFLNGEGKAVEVRSYAHTQAREGIVFQVNAASSTQVVVSAYDTLNDNLIGASVYYDALGDGSLVLVP